MTIEEKKIAKLEVNSRLIGKEIKIIGSNEWFGRVIAVVDEENVMVIPEMSDAPEEVNIFDIREK